MSKQEKIDSCQSNEEDQAENVVEMENLGKNYK